MSIAIGVGDLALALHDEDLEPEEIAEIREVWSHLNDFLAAHGLEPHHEPEGLPEAERTLAPAVGSSVRLRAELIELAHPLDIPLPLAEKDIAELTDPELTRRPLGIERALWYILFEAAGHSIQHRTAIRY
jgi:hypothetical protein